MQSNLREIAHFIDSVGNPYSLRKLLSIHNVFSNNSGFRDIWLQHARTDFRWIRAQVSKSHKSTLSRAAVEIESQFGENQKQISLRDTGYRYHAHKVKTQVGHHHYQGIGFLRDVIVSGKRYRRFVLSYNSGSGLSISAGLLNKQGDGVTSWDRDKAIHFKDKQKKFNIRAQPSMGNHDHPGGLQASGDLIAIAMEAPVEPNTRAAVYFIRVDGLTPRFIASLPLGTDRIPPSVSLASAASVGFIKLETGYLVAIGGENHATHGIWFYHTKDNSISTTTKWHLLDYWKPERMPDKLCRINRGGHSTNCFVGAGGGISLLANNNGDIYMVVTTGNDVTSSHRQLAQKSEYAQLYQVTVNPTETVTNIHLRAVWSGKREVGRWAMKNTSMRWGGAAQTTEDGRVLLINIERKNHATGSPSTTDGMIFINN